MQKNSRSSAVWVRATKRFIFRKFNIKDDQAPEEVIIAAVKSNTTFSGPYLWTLVFAIFIASIGLNVNSTAVIIGAMLISPLMGPIIGIGTGIGINDLELVKTGLRNFGIAVGISIATSFIYFLITPLHEAQSELLARTTPSLYDVLIGFFGGSAGMLAATRKEKSNVIPGVAIATALMPPLCTAGYGLATGNMYYFAGALYLFFINSVFICLSTYMLMRIMKFHKKHFENEKTKKHKIRYIWLIVLLAVVPSIYLTYNIVRQSIFESSAQEYLRENFRMTKTQIINRTLTYKNDSSVIDLLLIGEVLSPQKIDSLASLMPKYNMHHSKLLIRQGLNASKDIDFAQIKASVLSDVLSSDTFAMFSNPKPSEENISLELSRELQVLFPTIQDYYASKCVLVAIDSNTVIKPTTDTLTTFVAHTTRYLSRDERTKLSAWLKRRLGVDTVDIVLRKREQ